MFFNCHSLFNEAAYLAALHRLCLPFAICDAVSKQSETKIYEKTHLLLRISAVIGRYGPHLVIVMIFVTQNNLKRSRNFQPSPWILLSFLLPQSIIINHLSKDIRAYPFKTESHTLLPYAAMCVCVCVFKIYQTLK